MNVPCRSGIRKSSRRPPIAGSATAGTCVNPIARSKAELIPGISVHAVTKATNAFCEASRTERPLSGEKRTLFNAQFALTGPSACGQKRTLATCRELSRRLSEEMPLGRKKKSPKRTFTGLREMWSFQIHECIIRRRISVNSSSVSTGFVRKPVSLRSSSTIASDVSPETRITGISV
jgi:hypothetical protein